MSIAVVLVAVTVAVTVAGCGKMAAPTIRLGSFDSNSNFYDDPEGRTIFIASKGDVACWIIQINDEDEFETPFIIGGTMNKDYLVVSDLQRWIVDDTQDTYSIRVRTAGTGHGSAVTPKFIILLWALTDKAGSDWSTPLVLTHAQIFG